MTEEKKEHTSTPSPQKPRFFWRNVGILFSSMAVVVLVVVLGIAANKLLAINAGYASMLVQLQEAVTETQRKADAAQTAVASVEQMTQQMQTELKNQMERIAKLNSMQASTKGALQVAEAQYLVRLANDKLQLENNIGFAITLLQSADQQLKLSSDPNIFAIRKALATDLVALQNAPQMDVAGIHLQLSAMNQQVDKLSLQDAYTKSHQAEVVTDLASADLPWWKRWLSAMKNALQQIVIVRQVQQPIPPFVMPDQQVFFYQNIHTELENAQWALLRHQADIYQASLRQAIQWIRQYADQDAPLTQQLLHSLSTLEQVNIRPTTLTVNGTVEAFQQLKSREGVN